jgi:hypothetical protein
LAIWGRSSSIEIACWLQPYSFYQAGNACKNPRTQNYLNDSRIFLGHYASDRILFAKKCFRPNLFRIPAGIIAHFFLSGFASFFAKKATQSGLFHRSPGNGSVDWRWVVDLIRGPKNRKALYEGNSLRKKQSRGAR